MNTFLQQSYIKHKALICLSLLLFIFFSIDTKAQLNNLQRQSGIYSCNWTPPAANTQQVYNNNNNAKTSNPLNSLTSCSSCNDPVCRDQYLVNSNSDWLDVFLNVIVFRDDAGFSSIKIQDIEALLDHTELNFAPCHISFHHKITFIDSTEIRYHENNPSIWNVSANQGLNVLISPTKFFTSPIGTSGIWIRPYDVFGFMGPSNVLDPNHYVLTHEIGHALSLYHPWTPTYTVTQQGSCPPNEESFTSNNHDFLGDFCSDTKMTYEIANPTNSGSCTEILSSTFYDCSNVSYASAQIMGLADHLLENYMQYGPTICKTTFTPQQIARMRCYIMNNMIYAPQLPNDVTADFIANRRHTTTTNSVLFQNQSTNNCTSFFWDFGDGTNSTLANPSHIYNSVGYHNVSLTVTDGTYSHTKTKQSYIYITNVGNPLPYSQNFEAGNHFPPQDWVVENPDNDPINWRDGRNVEYYLHWANIGQQISQTQITIIGHNGNPTNAVFTDNNIFDNTPKDYLITPDFDLSSTCLSTPRMSFYMSYLPCSDPTAINCGNDYPGANPSVSTRGDGSPIGNAYQYLNGIIGYHKTLKIYASTDGGVSWPYVVYNKSDNALKTVNSACSHNRFTPQADYHWRKEEINLTSLLGNNKVRFKYEVYGDVLTNSLYIDDFSVEDIIPPSITISTSVVNTNCGVNAGSIDIQATGGTGLLLYSIDGGMTFLSSHLFSNLPVGSYQIYVKDANGCTAGSSASIQLIPLFTISTTVVNTQCNMSLGSITINPNGGPGPFQYSIDGGLTFSSSNVFTNLPTGLYQIYVKDVNGCSVSTTAGISYINIGMATTNIIPPSCNASNGSITLQILNSSVQPFSYQMIGYFGSTQIASATGTTYNNTLQFTNLSYGSYTVTINDLNNGCSYVRKFVMGVPGTGTYVNLPQVVSDTCGSSVGVVSFFVQNLPNLGVSTPTINIYYQNGPLFTSLPANTNIAAVNLYTGNYTAEVIYNGCTISLGTFTIGNVITQSVLPTIQEVDEYCNQNNGQINFFSNITNSTIYEVGIEQIMNNNFNVTILPLTQFTGAYTVNNLSSGFYRIIIKEIGGPKCWNIIYVTIEDLPFSSVSMQGLLPVYCTTDNNAYTLIGSPAGGTFSGLGVVGNIFNPSLATPGTYNITYSYNGGVGCSGSVTQAVQIFNSSSVGFSGLASHYCTGNSPVTLTGFPVGGSFFGTGISGNTFDPSIAGIGTHNVVYTYSSTTCSGYSQQTVEVFPLPSVSINAPSSICLNSYPISVIGSPGGGTFSGNGINGNAFYPNQVGIGPHIITYSYTDANLCSNSTTQQIVVNPLPIVSFSGLPITMCLLAPPVNLTGSPSGGVFFGTGITGNGFNPILAGVGTHVVSYKYTDGNGCINLSSMTTDVLNAPSLSVTGSPTIICSGDATAFSQLNANGAQNYNWTPTTFLNNSTIANPISHPTITTTYTVVGTAANSCTNSATVTIQVQPPAFTLGSDIIACQNTTFTLGTGVYNSNQYSYSWYPINTNGSPGASFANTSTVSITANWAPSIAGRNFRLCIKHPGSGCVFCDDINVKTKIAPCGKTSRNADNNSGNIGFEVYPIPNDGKFSVSLTQSSEEELNFQIFNQLGQLVFDQQHIKPIDNHFDVNLKDIEPGIYFIQVRNTDLTVLGLQKIIVQK